MVLGIRGTGWLPLVRGGDEDRLGRDTKNFWNAGDNLYFDLGGDHTSVYMYM